MAVRTTMADLISTVRMMINDPAGSNQNFTDQQIQDQLDKNREDVRYEGLTIAPSIINNANTSNQPQTVFADYYSKYQYWEADVTVQAYQNGLAWVVITPAAQNLVAGHWQFELNVYATGTVPGQLPPVFVTGKSFDPNASAADLLEFWAATVATDYDFTADQQTFHRSQKMDMKLKLAAIYRKRARPHRVKMYRDDVMSPIGSRRLRLLDQDDVVKGA
jgi:hypothetical protein